MEYNEDETQEIIKLNGQTVTAALTYMKGNATEKDISDYIVHYTGQPKDLVITEVNRILRYGVNAGFLVKNGNSYKFPGRKNVYRIDCDDREDNPEPDSTTESEEEEEEEEEAGARGGVVSPEGDGAAVDMDDQGVDEAELLIYLDSPEFAHDLEMAVDITYSIRDDKVSSTTSD